METKRKDETTITVRRATLQRIKELCKRSENYDIFINRLLDAYEKEVSA